jgi:hypothetical protein
MAADRTVGVRLLNGPSPASGCAATIHRAGDDRPIARHPTPGGGSRPLERGCSARREGSQLRRSAGWRNARSPGSGPGQAVRRAFPPYCDMVDTAVGEFFKNANLGGRIGATLLFQHQDDCAAAESESIFSYTSPSSLSQVRSWDAISTSFPADIAWRPAPGAVLAPDVVQVRDVAQGPARAARIAEPPDAAQVRDAAAGPARAARLADVEEPAARLAPMRVAAPAPARAGRFAGPPDARAGQHVASARRGSGVARPRPAGVLRGPGRQRVGRLPDQARCLGGTPPRPLCSAAAPAMLGAHPRPQAAPERSRDLARRPGEVLPRQSGRRPGRLAGAAASLGAHRPRQVPARQSLGRVRRRDGVARLAPMAVR